jgi:hypothetical protein
VMVITGKSLAEDPSIAIMDPIFVNISFTTMIPEPVATSAGVRYNGGRAMGCQRSVLCLPLEVMQYNSGTCLSVKRIRRLSGRGRERRSMLQPLSYERRLRAGST